MPTNTATATTQPTLPDGITDYTGQYAIAAARFNQPIVAQLVSGAKAALAAHGIGDAQVDCVWTPGAFELPLACKQLAHSAHADYAAVIALGAVVRGETPHFNYVAGECARGIAQLNLTGNTPIIFGVLTTDTMQQARVRADIKRGNKGAAAALAALQMVDLLRRI